MPDNIGDEFRIIVIVFLVGYALICLIAAIQNYGMMWMIIQYIKYCNSEKAEDTVERELFLKVNSLYAVFKPLEFTD